MIASAGTEDFALLDGSLVLSVAEIIERATPRAGDTVVVSGTLIEGIGNRHSDIDVYVIGDTLPERQHMGKHNHAAVEAGMMRAYYDYIGEDGFGFDVEYFTWKEIDAVLKDFAELHEQARKKTKILRRKMHITHYDFVHKIAVGKILCGASALEPRFTSEVFDMIAFSLYRSRTGGYPEFKDILGFWAAGDLESCLQNMDTYLKDQAAGLYHLTGGTNSKPKWLFANLRRLPDELQSLGVEITAWCQADRSTSERRAFEILRGCDMIDKINRAATRLLDVGPAAYYTSAEALELTEAEFSQEAFHDRQTVLEFEHRRMLFGQAARPMRDFLEEAA